MTVVAIFVLGSRFCDACVGEGYRPVLINGQVHLKAICPDCEGQGDVPSDYFIEFGTGRDIDKLTDDILSEGV